MEKQLYFTTSITLLWLLIALTGVVTQVPSFDGRFSRVDAGDGVTVQVEEGYSFITLDECIVR